MRSPPWTRDQARRRSYAGPTPAYGTDQLWMKARGPLVTPEATRGKSRFPEVSAETTMTNETRTRTGKDGQDLEWLVAFTERLVLPPGVEVKTSQRLYEDGVQMAEFDIEVRGKVGSIGFAWLIECRDRPSGGPAPAAWIQQLIGRRHLFPFKKVTAVSTTGFAPGAIKQAQESGIELREVKELSEETVLPWLNTRYLEVRKRECELAHAELHADNSTPDDRMSELATLLSRKSIKEVVLRSTRSNERAGRCLWCCRG